MPVKTKKAKKVSKKTAPKPPVKEVKEPVIESELTPDDDLVSDDLDTEPEEPVYKPSKPSILSKHRMPKPALEISDDDLMEI